MKNPSIKLVLMAAATAIAMFLSSRMVPHFETGIDDANIYFVYAKNFIEGYGIVYNQGGERVEGYSSVLWFLFCALAMWLTGKVEISLLFVNWLCISAILIAGYSYIEKQGRSQFVAHFKWGFILILLASPGFILWTGLSLLENALWTMALMLMAISVSSTQAKTWQSLTIALVIASRPEGIGYAAIAVTLIFLSHLSTSKPTQALYRTSLPAITYFSTILIIFIGRYTYFDYLFPNTYYAKVDSNIGYNISVGSKYFLNFFVSNPFSFLSISLIGLALANIAGERIKKPTASLNTLEILAIFCCAGLVTPIILGGDHFAEYRFYQNVFPIFLLTSALYLDKILIEYSFQKKILTRLDKFLTNGVLIAVLFLLALKGYRGIAQSDAIGEFMLAHAGRERALAMNDLFSDTATMPNVGVVAAGGFKYEYNGPVFDVLGLNHIAMGHNPGDRKGIKNNAAFNKAVFYQFAPDLLTIELKEAGWPITKESVINNYIISALRGIFYDKQFQEIFTYASIQPNNNPANIKIIGWVRNDYLAQLEKDGFQIKKYNLFTTQTPH